MRYVLAVACLLAPSLAFAQSSQMQLAPMHHGGAHVHGGPMAGALQTSSATPKEAGQSAFAAIQEIVALLRADPKTDWSKVNIEALRQHLIDMNNVTLSANVKTEATSQAVKFIVTGAGDVQASIQRMVLAHADAMSGTNGWTMKGEKIADGASLTVSASEAELVKVKALGFIGVMSDGMHHQAHHLALATGVDPHHQH